MKLVLRNFTNQNIPLYFILLLCGCASLQPFPNDAYQRNADVCLPYYETKLTCLRGMDYDSEQVSNKFLDHELIEALAQVNFQLAHSETLPHPCGNILQSSGLKKITLASAARTPWHQASLASTYKAQHFASMHSLGLAADLEMKGQPFDVSRRASDPNVQACYEALRELLNSCGLCFSEPQNLDANHVELLRYSRKSPTFNKSAWRQKNLNWWTGLRDDLQLKLSNGQPYKDINPSRNDERVLERLLLDIQKEIESLE